MLNYSCFRIDVRHGDILFASPSFPRRCFTANFHDRINALPKPAVLIKSLSEASLKGSTAHNKLRGTVDNARPTSSDAWSKYLVKQDRPCTRVSLHFSCELFLPVPRS